MNTLTEANVEQAALGWLSSLGWAVVFRSDTPNPEKRELLTPMLLSAQRGHKSLLVVSSEVMQ